MDFSVEGCGADIEGHRVDVEGILVKRVSGVECGFGVDVVHEVWADFGDEEGEVLKFEVS